MKFLSSEVVLYLYKSTTQPCMEYCCYVGTVTASYLLHMLPKLQKQVCRTVCSSRHNSFQSLVYCQNLASLSYVFIWRLIYSFELTELVPLLHSCGRSSCYSNSLHNFSIHIPWFMSQLLLKNTLWNRFNTCVCCLFFSQMIAFQKLWKMLFIPSTGLFSLLRNSNFCNFPPSFSHFLDLKGKMKLE